MDIDVSILSLVRYMCQGMLCLTKIDFLPKRAFCLLRFLLSLYPIPHSDHISLPHNLSDPYPLRWQPHLPTNILTFPHANTSSLAHDSTSLVPSPLLHSPSTSFVDDTPTSTSNNPTPMVHSTTSSSINPIPISPITKSDAPSSPSLVAQPSSSVAPNYPLSNISNITAHIPSHPMVTCSKTGHLKPRDFSDYKVLLSSKHHVCALTSVSIPLEPICYSQAMLSPEWCATMGDEFDALLENKTWSLCPRPSHHNIIQNKWVFKIKQKQDGSIDRYKMQLVAKRFDQESGVDYTETFSHVVKTSTIWVLLALAV
jgi:hypothetical protein